MLNKIEPGIINENVFNMIGKRWTLITAGGLSNFNTMTASWGGLGVIWNKNVVTVYVRKHRYTYQFIENSDNFTLSFFGEEHRKALQICGSESGRDGDKIKKAGLTPMNVENCIAFEEADTVLLCKKIYRHEIGPENMINLEPEKLYPMKDYHVLYIGEIISAYKKEI